MWHFNSFFKITYGNFHKNVNENICNFAILDWIFMKFAPKCRTKKLGMLYSILGRFCSFFNWEWANILPKSGLGESMWVCESLKIVIVNYLLNARPYTANYIFEYLGKFSLFSPVDFHMVRMPPNELRPNPSK